MWIVPGNHFICIVERQTRQGVGVGCFTTKDALDHGVVAITLGSSSKSTTRIKRIIAGVAPDAARAVIARTRGTEVRIPVSRNGVFVLRDRAFNPPDRLTIVRKAGA